MSPLSGPEILAGARRRDLPVITKFVFAGSVLAGSSLLRWSVDRFVPIPIPFTFYLLSIVATTAVCGKRWGYATVAVSVVLAMYLWIPPRFSLRLAKAGDATDVVVWALTSAFIVWVLAALQRTVEAHAALAERLRRQSAELSEKAAALVQSEAKLKVYSEELEQLVAERTEKLTETLTELESFSYSVSHNLRSPLRAMQGFAHLALSENEPQLSPRSREYLGRIDDAARRMDQLIQDLTVFNRAGSSDEVPQAIELATLIEELVRMRPEWHARGATIDVTQAQVTVHANRTALLQVLDQILGNACKFVPPTIAPRVRVTAERTSDGVRVRIADNGVGVPAEFRPRLFKPFGRAHSDRAFPGRGMGLAIARKLVRQMGGNLGLESSASDGSVFFIELPSRRVP